MSLYLLLAFFVFQIASAQNRSRYCCYDQGHLDFCRIDSKLSLRLPIHAKRAFLSRIEDSDLVDQIILEEHDLDQHRLLVKSDSVLHGPSCKIESSDGDFLRFADLTDRNIRPNGWYVLCAEYDVVGIRESSQRRKSVRNREPNEEKSESEEVYPQHQKRAIPEDHKCTRCSILKESTDFPTPKLLQTSWVKDRLESGILLRYMVGDLPFESAKISGRVINLDDRRQVYQFNQVIKPRQQVFIRVSNVEEFGRYFVITNLQPLNKNGSQLIINDLHLDFQDYIRLEAFEEKRSSGAGGKN